MKTRLAVLSVWLICFAPLWADTNEEVKIKDSDGTEVLAGSVAKQDSDGNPRIIRLLETPIYDEELEYLRGRLVPGVTRGYRASYTSVQTLPHRPKSVVQIPAIAPAGSKDIRCRPPRPEPDEGENDFRRYKANWLTKHGREGERAVEDVKKMRNTR